jgi:hypothetical protein
VRFPYSSLPSYANINNLCSAWPGWGNVWAQWIIVGSLWCGPRDGAGFGDCSSVKDETLKEGYPAQEASLWTIPTCWYKCETLQYRPDPFD